MSIERVFPLVCLVTTIACASSDQRGCQGAACGHDAASRMELDAGRARHVNGSSSPNDASGPVTGRNDGGKSGAAHDGGFSSGPRDASLDGRPPLADAGARSDARSVQGTVLADFIYLQLLADVIASDPARARLYVYTRAPDATLVTVDSKTGEVLSNASIGPDVSAMAVAEDGSTLWAASVAEHELRKVDLTSTIPKISGRFALPPEWQLDRWVVVPPAIGTASALLDLRGGPTTYLGPVSLDSGSAKTTGPYGTVGYAITGGPPGYFFDLDSTPNYFVTIDARGQTFVKKGYDYITSELTQTLAYDVDGYVYADSGEIVDVRTPSAPHRIGKFELPTSNGLTLDHELLPVPASGDVLRVSYPANAATLDIELLDSTTFLVAGTIQFPAPTHLQAPILIDGDRVAFIGTGPAGLGVYLTRKAPAPTALVKVEPVVRNDTIEVPIGAQAFVADPGRGVLYASVFAGAPAYQNRVVTIDASTGAITNDLFVGSDPGPLALSDDASELWVGLTGSSSVRRIDLGGSSPRAQPARDLDQSGVVTRLISIPGNPLRVFAAQEAYGRALNYPPGLFLDDGVVRPGFPTFFESTEVVAGPKGTLFTANQRNDQFCTISYDETGASQTCTLDFSLYAYVHRGLSFDPAGIVYAAREVIDVRKPQSPVILGRFPMSGSVLPLGNSVGLMISGDTLYKVDATTFSSTASRPVECGQSADDYPHGLARAGKGRVAFLSDAGMCIVTDPTFIP